MSRPPRLMKPTLRLRQFAHRALPDRKHLYHQLAGFRDIYISPSGQVLPCHAAETISDMTFENVRQRNLADIWRNSDSFNRFRGTDWMPEPCASCERKEIDWGGCRCQALALTGDAARTDPVCNLSADHGIVAAIAEEISTAGLAPPYIYRRIGAAG